MGWSWKIGEVRGIAIRVHATFAILLAWIALAELGSGETTEAALAGIAFMLAIFAIIVLHELGHALTALRFGIRTRDITLLPIGGVARLERIPEKPEQELVIALAGPAVNYAIAAALLAALALLDRPIVPAPLGAGGFFAKLAWANVVIGTFNLIPAFPMDGGRVLRALLATSLDYTRATEIAAGVGQAIAFVFGLVGIFANPFLIFIALFVWLGAAAEAATAQLRSALAGIPVARAMVREFQTLAPDDTLGTATAHFLAGFQHDFPVLEEGRLVGVLTRVDLLGGLARDGAGAPVRAAMRTRFGTAHPSEMLEQAIARLDDGDDGTPSLPVVRDGRVVGIVVPESVAELLGVRRALHAHARGPRATTAPAR